MPLSLKIPLVLIYDNEEIEGGYTFLLKNIELSSSDIIIRYSWKIPVYNKLELFLGRLEATMVLKFKKAAPMVCLEF